MRGGCSRAKTGGKGRCGLKNLNRSYYNPPFSHIYVEREVAEDPETKRILTQFPQAEVIDIDHYKDVFCRSRQDYVRQHAGAESDSGGEAR